MAAFFYDIEIVPNYFSVKFTGMDDSEHLFEVYKDKNDIQILCEFLNNPKVTTLISYNGNNYDDLILQWILNNKNNLHNLPQVNVKLKKINDLVINPDSFGFDTVKKIRNSMYRYPLPFVSVDLQRLHHLDVKKVSLKRVMIILKMDNVLEWEPDDITLEDVPTIRAINKDYSTINTVVLNDLSDEEVVTTYNKLPKFEKFVLDRHLEPMREYNAHDVEALQKLYIESKDELNLRTGVAETFGIPEERVISLSRSSMAERLLVKFYSEQSGQKPSEFRNTHTIVNKVKLSDVIDPHIKFESEELKKFYNRVESTTIVLGDKIEFKVVFDGTEYTIARGGIHSVDKPEILRSDEKYVYKDADVSSYYPTIMQNLYIAPRHLDSDAFLKMIISVKTKRLEAKQQYKYKLKRGEDDHKLFIVNEGLKIVINAIFGKLGEDGRWLNDFFAFLRVTINGQLYLLNLIERLSFEGIRCVSANTDGIVCKVPRDKEDIYYTVCKEWEDDFNFELEYTNYDVYARKDVNNYISIIDKDKGEDGGNIKTKGIFSQKLALDKGYKHPIVAKAIYDFIVHKKDVSETIKGCKNIKDFCISVNVNRKFNTIGIDRLNYNSEKILYPRTNRYFASNKGQLLYKWYKEPEYDKKGILREKILLESSTGVEVLNNITDDDASKYDINYRYYIKEAQVLVRTVSHTQTTLDLF